MRVTFKVNLYEDIYLLVFNVYAEYCRDFFSAIRH